MNVFPHFARCMALLSCFYILTGCSSMQSNSVEQRRSSIMEMKNSTLGELYRLKPDVKPQLESAPGYAVFSNANVNVILASFGGGYGMAKDNRSGAITYMKMGEVGLGLGAGIKDFRVVFVFHTREALQRFVEQGWGLGVQADAAAKAGEKGAAVAGEAQIDNVSIYQLTQSGLALQATIKGTKYWKDPELN